MTASNLIAAGAMIVLGALDFAGALLARRWAHGGSVVWFVAGALCFVALFWVYGRSLRYADLVVVTFGWVAALQVGLLLVNRTQAGRAMPLHTWLAAGAIIVLEGVLIASSNTA
jgi:hypothetical protein